MNKKILLSLLFLITFSTQAVSTIPPISKGQSNYYVIAKVWGFLKYFHPALKQNKIHPDKFLTDSLLSQVSQETSAQELNKVLLMALNLLKEQYPVEKRESSNLELLRAYNFTIYSQNRMAWLQKLPIEKAIKERLLFIYENYPLVNNLFVYSQGGSGILNFDPDSNYFNDRTSITDKNIRLLALFRLWNVLEYFFPSTYLMDQNWDTTLKQFIPDFLNAKDELSYNKVCLRLNKYIDDSHAFISIPLIDQVKGDKLIPLALTQVEEKEVILSNFSNQKIPTGSVLTKINDKAVKDIKEGYLEYVVSSNNSALQRDLNDWLLYSKLSESKINYLFKGKEYTTTLKSISMTEYYTLIKKAAEAKKKWKIIEGNIGYVDMGILENSDIQKMFEELWETDGIIFDIRNYPKGTMWNMINYFYDRPTPTHFFTMVNPMFPGVITQNPPMAISSHLDYSKTYKKQIVLLFNEVTQSQAEYTIMAFEAAKNVIKVGSQTAGADGNIVRVYLPGKVSTYFSSLGVYYPNGEETQRIGIKPDIEVKPTIQALQNGRDLLMEKAIEIVENSIPKP